jgi:hypothetical protein
MKRIGLAFVVLCAVIALRVQAVSGQQTSFPLDVSSDSAFVRALPAADAPVIASVFFGDVLQAVGRSADGTWLQLQRPAGWISRSVVRLSLDIGALPLTDTTTGVTGSSPIVDTGYTVQVIDDRPMYALPDFQAQAVAILAINAVLPAIERTPDNQWIRVNYLGTVGWIPVYLAYNPYNVDALPISPTYAADPNYPPVISIPPERQLAQIDRLLAYLAVQDALALQLVGYWDVVVRGGIVECAPRSEVVAYYTVTPDDVRELPELRPQERFLRQAVDDLNESLAATHVCGIQVYVDFSGARANAMNAHVLFRRTRLQMEAARERVLGAAG